MTQKILTWSFYILFFFLPLVFIDKTSELFEYNKMMFVYVATIIIATTWIVKMINTKSFIFKRTPLDIPLALFLLSQILSTIFSIDPHTSIWGYYSRSNGGLLSIISYILLYYALVSNFDFDQALKFLKATLFGGLVVALWAIPEHFGVSPSCALLVGEFNDSCWVQDVQSRVFATLGQPNWLAAYMEMLIFPALYFALTAKSKFQTIFYFLISVLYYMAFTFTYSRGATLGFFVGLAVFVGFIFYNQLVLVKKSEKTLTRREAPLTLVKLTLTAVLLFVLVNILYGSAVTRFQLINPTSPVKSSAPVAGTTQLENGGTESGQIRLIVWKGALEIFKHYPVLGSGVETFAYSYYNFRPVEHNSVSEWDFLYNKAHNEYLNYLSTTGLVGFLSYMGIIAVFISWSLLRMLNYQLIMINQIPFFKLTKSKTTLTHKEAQLTTYPLLLTTAILASYLAYLIQDFFGFSVVAVAVLFYVFPAYSFLALGEVKNHSFHSKFFAQLLNKTLFRRAIYGKIIKVFIVLIAIGLLNILRSYWVADTLYKTGMDDSDAGSVGKAFNELSDAVDLNPNEPLYHSELGYAAAASAVATSDSDATQSAYLKTKAISENQTALTISPKNVSLWRTAIRTNYELSIVDPNFDRVTLDTFDKTIALAPTDPKLEYNKALILEQLKRYSDAILVDQKAIQLKPDYPDAIFKLGELYQENGQKEEAKEQFQRLLKLIPNQPDALKKLDELNGKK